MNFAWPWCFLLLPLPWLLRRWLRPMAAGAALRVPRLPVALAAQELPGSGWSLWLASLVWLLLVAASARPQVPQAPTDQLLSGRNLMLAFDVSASMATQDIRLGDQRVERLQGARLLADEFLQQRRGDRVGLIVFGSQAYLHTPLTFDLDSVRLALATMEIGFAGPETALGDAIGLATLHLKPVQEQSRELVLMTDGANTAGTLTPARAAWLAQREGVRIHVIGIGAASVGVAQTRAPAPGLDEATLRQMAEQSGGSYQRATDAAAIGDFFRRLAQNRPVTEGLLMSRPQRALYPWPLALALGLTLWLAWCHLRQSFTIRGRE